MIPSKFIAPAESPNGGSVDERRSLHERFEDRLSVNPSLTRKMVSYQGNRHAPGFRWMKYKEGFSRGLVEQLIGEVRPQSVLDPFSGIGTTPLIAAGQGLRAAGIEIIPVGVLVGNAIAHAANGLESDEFRVASESLLKRVDCPSEAHEEYAFPHVRITESAFPPETESGLAKAREFINTVDDPGTQAMLEVACMSVLESVSYTRKDGQYLRWDPSIRAPAEGPHEQGTDLAILRGPQGSIPRNVGGHRVTEAPIREWRP